MKEEEIKLVGMEVSDRGLEAQFAANPVVRRFIDAWVQLFVESGAQNYFEFQAMSPDIGNFLVTIQRVDGKTPATLRAEAEEKVERLLTVLEDALSIAENTWEDLNLSPWADMRQVVKEMRGL